MAQEEIGKEQKMKKFLFTLVAIMMMAVPAMATEVKEQPAQAENQVLENENSYLGINFMKQPEENGGKQLVTNKKSFLFINVVINGKPVEVKAK